MNSYSWFSRDVTAAMLVYRTIAQKFFWEFDSIIMQNLSDILPLFCTPAWPSHHVSENQELFVSFSEFVFQTVTFFNLEEYFAMLLPLIEMTEY